MVRFPVQEFRAQPRAGSRSRDDVETPASGQGRSSTRNGLTATTMPVSSRAVRYALVLGILVLLASPTDAYFMKCKQFCYMLTQDEIHQLMCVYNMCRKEKLGKHILRFAKRGLVVLPNEVPDSLLEANSVSPLLSGRLGGLPGVNAGTGSQAGKGSFLRSLWKAREGELGTRRPLPPVEEKRDLEYWDGPAPADINA